MLESNRFRLDLFYRINALTIYVHPLRDKKEDLPILTKHFIEEFNRKYDRRIKGVSGEVMEKFNSYDWPGNIRELRNEIGRACSFSNRDVLRLEDFSARLRDAAARNPTVNHSRFSRKKLLENTEKELIIEILKNTGGNKAQAAKMLNLSRTMLYKKIRNLGIEL